MGKNALLNGIKTACSILFPFVSFAYCSRVLGANGLGQYSFGQSIISYLLLVATLGIPNYAIREGTFIRDNGVELNNFIKQIFTISCFMTVVAYMVLGILLIYWPKLHSYKIIILIESIQIILTTLGADWINSIYEDYLYLAVRYIIIQIVAIIALIFFVKSPKDLYIYTFISVMSNAGGNILNWKYLQKKKIRLSLVKNIDFKKHMVPIFILFFNSVASIVYLNSDITMLGIWGNNYDVGVYTVSSKVYSMLKSLINSIIMVTLPRFSTYISGHQKDRYQNSVKEVQEILMLLTMPVAVGLFMEGDKILDIIAGSEYESGTIVVKVLAIAIPFAVEACFFTYSILIPNRLEKYFLISTAAAALLNIILNIILLPQYGIFAAALTTLIAEIVVIFITGYFSKNIVSVKISKSIIVQIGLSCFFLIITCRMIDGLKIMDNLKLLLDIIVGAFIYIWCLYIMKCKWIRSIPVIH